MSTRPLRVLCVSPEASPYAKAGRLADAVAFLSAELKALGVEITLVLPKYRRPEIETAAAEAVVSDFPVPVGRDQVKAGVFRSSNGAVPVYFIDSAKYFCRDEIYGSAQGAYLDNDERFTFFDRAVLEFALAAEPAVDVIHCHDWPTALIPLFLRTHYDRESRFLETATVFTVHDPAFQGAFPPESLALAGLHWDLLTSGRFAWDGTFNFLKAGLMFADVFNAVRPGDLDGPAAVAARNGIGAILAARRNVFSVVPDGEGGRTWRSAAQDYLRLYERALNIRRGGHRV